MTKDNDDIHEKIKKLKEKEGSSSEAHSAKDEGKGKTKQSKEHAEIERLTKENEELKSQALRAMADLQNSRRRMEEEKKTLLSYASSQVIQEFLPIIDNFELSFSHLPENLKNEEWIKGVEHILTQSKQILERNGIANIVAKPGDKVDPSLHEVVMKADGKPGEIVEVLQKGYMQNGKIIRTAKVKAA